MTPPRIQPIPAQHTHALRHRVLRPHQPLDEMAYPGDDDPGTIHLGVFTTQTQIVGIVSLYHEPISPHAGLPPKPGDWRLRGMAVDTAHQGRGYGKQLVKAGQLAAQAAGAARIWCNARTTAAGFYQRLGFRTAGQPFDLPGIGEHNVMWIAV
ncbi:MAG: GNAT family N-acetyltransferase [Phycisphaerales bacterium JB063]